MSLRFAEKFGLLIDVACGCVSFGDGWEATRPSRLTKQLNVQLGDHRERLEFVATTLDRGYDAILGMPWLEYHKPAVTWKTRELELSLGRWRVVVKGGQPVQVQGAPSAPEIHQVSLAHLRKDVR